METGPEDEPGMRWSSGIATAHGGLASHAAIYSRGLGLPAVCGIAELNVTESSIDIGGVTINEGQKFQLMERRVKSTLENTTSRSRNPFGTNNTFRLV